MNDHLHDLDLIAAYAEGDHEAAAQARRLLDECDRCRIEYENQRHVKQLLAALPPVQMTEDERQRLHRVLDRPPTAKVLTLTERRRAQRWMKIGTVAAGLFVAVGLGSVFLAMNRGPGGDDGAFAALSETTAAAATTTAAAERDSAAPEAGSMAFDGADLRLYSGGDREAVKAEIEQLINDSLAAGESTVEYMADRPEPRCWEQVDDVTVLAGAESILDGQPIIIYIIEDGDGQRGRVFDQATCSEIDLG